MSFIIKKRLFKKRNILYLKISFNNFFFLVFAYIMKQIYGVFIDSIYEYRFIIEHLFGKNRLL